MSHTAENELPKASPLQIFERNGIEIYQIDTDIMGTHALHWEALFADPENEVPTWLGAMIDDAIIPIGFAENASTDDMPDKLLIANDTDVHLCQVFMLDEQQKPSGILTAFPCVNSPYTVVAKIERIMENTETCEAVLRLAMPDGTTLYAFDTLYAINQPSYEADVWYEAELSGVCHGIEHFTEDETLTITDPEAIRHHRALNDVLAANEGNVPDDLQEQLAKWQPKDEIDTQPVTLNLGKMCAYLFGEHTGQEDEAWCQAEVLGLQNVTIFGKSLYLLDIAVLREENTQAVVVRAVSTVENAPKGLQVGDFIRTNVWIQVKICAKNVNNL